MSIHVAGSIAQAKKIVTVRLHGAGIDTAHLDARLLVNHAVNRDPGWIVGNPESILSSSQWDHLEGLVKRRERREPLAYIFGRKEFWSFDFRVNSATLIPRPESETLVQATLERLPHGRDTRILDLGTGTGCLLLAILSERLDTKGLGVDNNPAALEIARRNAAELGFTGRTVFRESSWFSALNADVEGGFDAIVTNPPYVMDAKLKTLAPEITSYEPEKAFRGGADGLDPYRKIFAGLPNFLCPGGLFVGEFGSGQVKAVQALAQNAGLTIIDVKNDLAGEPRVIIASTPKDRKN